MTETYGYGPELWEEAREEARQILIRCAREGQRISYSELAGHMKVIKFKRDAHAFHHLLGEISREEHAAGRGMLSSLVVRKRGNRRPGDGFFKLARELGEQFAFEEDFWRGQLKKVIDCWRTETRDGSDTEASHSS